MNMANESDKFRVLYDSGVPAFLNWLYSQGIELSLWEAQDNPSVPHKLVRNGETAEQILFRYADIDARQLENERRGFIQNFTDKNKVND